MVGVHTRTSSPVCWLPNSSQSAAEIRAQLVYVYGSRGESVGEWYEHSNNIDMSSPYLLPMLGSAIRARMKASSRALQASPLDCVRWSQRLEIVATDLV